MKIMESVVQLIQNVLPWHKQRTYLQAALLLQGLWCVVTVVAAAIIVAIEARTKNVRACQNGWV
jgi:Tfp pilus assembly protein PilN